MRINRSLLNWGVFLIALGGIPLAVDQGWLEPDIAQDLGRLWPLILVGIGLGLILRWTPLSWFGGALVAATFGLIFGAAAVSLRDNDLANLQGIIPAIASGTCAGDEVGGASERYGGLTDADEFSVELTLNCGGLELTRAAGASWALEARHDPDDPPRVEEVERDGTVVGLRLDQGASDDLALFGSRSQSRWDLEAPASAVWRVDATLNAAEATIDAGAGPIARVAGTINASDVSIDLAEASTPTPGSVDLTLNASDGRLALPAGDISVAIDLNASSLTVCAPRGAELRVDYSSVLGGDDLGSSDLVDEGSGQWVTPGFAGASERISLDVTNTVSSFSLERPEACS